MNKIYYHLAIKKCYLFGLYFFTTEGLKEIPSGCYFSTDLTQDIRKAHKFMSKEEIYKEPKFCKHTTIITIEE